MSIRVCYRTSHGSRIYNAVNNEINLPNQEILEIDIPDGITSINLADNLLTTIALPASMKKAIICRNRLVDVDIKHGIEFVNMASNRIKTIELPPDTRDINLSDNYLTDIVVPRFTHYIDLSNNELTRVALAKSVTNIDLRYNYNLVHAYVGKKARVTVSDGTAIFIRK